MKKAKELLEVLGKDISGLGEAKINMDELPTAMASSLEHLMKTFKKVKFNADKQTGTFVYRGDELKFSLGSENFYFELPRMFVKGGTVEAANAIKKLLDVVNNWGGTVKT